MMTAQEALNYWVGEYQKEVAKRQTLQADNDRLRGALRQIETMACNIEWLDADARKLDHRLVAKIATEALGGKP